MADYSYKCSFCGKTVNPDNFSKRTPISRQMAKYHSCFECRFWQNMLENPIPGTIVASGKLIRAKLNSGKCHWRYKARPSTIYLLSVSAGIRYYSVDWHLYGTIPEHFKDRFPDSYKLITVDTYDRLKLRTSKRKCKLKGCFDRYNCLWYDQSIEDGVGPYNRLPYNYKPGMECCETFINKNTIYDVKLP